MTTFNIAATHVNVSATPATLLKIGFGSPAQNTEIVKDAKAALEACQLQGGELVLLNGPASLPVACVITHGVCHKFSAVGVFDPKMSGYVVSIAHGGKYNVGDVIPAADVQS